MAGVAVMAAAHNCLTANLEDAPANLEDASAIEDPDFEVKQISLALEHSLQGLPHHVGLIRVVIGDETFTPALLQAMEDAELAKLRGRVLHARGALESDVFLLFSDRYTTEGELSANGRPRSGVKFAPLPDGHVGKENAADGRRRPPALMNLGHLRQRRARTSRSSMAGIEEGEEGDEEAVAADAADAWRSSERASVTEGGEGSKERRFSRGSARSRKWSLGGSSRGAERGLSADGASEPGAPEEGTMEWFHRLAAHSHGEAEDKRPAWRASCGGRGSLQERTAGEPAAGAALVAGRASMEGGKHPAWGYGGAPSARPTQDTSLTGNGSSAVRRSAEGGRLQPAWRIAGSGDPGCGPGEETGWNSRPKPAGSNDAGRKSMEGGEPQPAWKPGGSAHAAWNTFEAYIGEHPEAWIGPWKKVPEGKWQPDWVRGMESEYRSMREVMEEVLLRDVAPDPEKTGGKPPWKVPGSGASAPANRYSASGLEGEYRSGWEATEQALHREADNEPDRSGSKPVWKVPGSGASGSASRYSASGMHNNPYTDPAAPAVLGLRDNQKPPERLPEKPRSRRSAAGSRVSQMGSERISSSNGGTGALTAPDWQHGKTLQQPLGQQRSGGIAAVLDGKTSGEFKGKMFSTIVRDAVRATSYTGEPAQETARQPVTRHAFGSAFTRKPHPKPAYNLSPTSTLAPQKSRRRSDVNQPVSTQPSVLGSGEDVGEQDAGQEDWGGDALDTVNDRLATSPAWPEEHGLQLIGGRLTDLLRARRRSTGSFALLPGEQLLPGVLLHGGQNSAELGEDGNTPASVDAHLSELSRLKDPSTWAPYTPVRRQGSVMLSKSRLARDNKPAVLPAEGLAQEQEPAAESPDEPWPEHSRGNRDAQRHIRLADGTGSGTPTSTGQIETRSDEVPAAYRVAAAAAKAAPNQENEVASKASEGHLESFVSALDYVLGHPEELGSADLSWMIGGSAPGIKPANLSTGIAWVVPTTGPAFAAHPALSSTQLELAGPQGELSMHGVKAGQSELSSVQLADASFRSSEPNGKRVVFASGEEQNSKRPASAAGQAGNSMQQATPGSQAVHQGKRCAPAEQKFDAVRAALHEDEHDSSLDENEHDSSLDELSFEDSMSADDVVSTDLQLDAAAELSSGRAALLQQTTDHIGLEGAAGKTRPAKGGNGRAAVKTHPGEAVSSAKHRSRKVHGVSATQGQAVDVLGATASRPSGASTKKLVEGAIDSESESLSSEGDTRSARVSQQATEEAMIITTLRRSMRPGTASRTAVHMNALRVEGGSTFPFAAPADDMTYRASQGLHRMVPGSPYAVDLVQSPGPEWASKYQTAEEAATQVRYASLPGLTGQAILAQQRWQPQPEARLLPYIRFKTLKRRAPIRRGPAFKFVLGRPNNYRSIERLNILVAGLAGQQQRAEKRSAVSTREGGQSGGDLLMRARPIVAQPGT